MFRLRVAKTASCSIPTWTDVQLDLFDEMTEATPLATVEADSSDERNGSAESTRPNDSGALDALPSNDGCGPQETESAWASGLCGAGIDGGSSVRVGGSPEDGISVGLGNSHAGMGLSSERGRSAATIVRSFDVEPPSTLARDFRISAVHRIGEGSLKVKAHANLAAIRTLKLIEKENRTATSEEKAVLVKYAGWGALANVFTAHPPREWQAVAAELRDSLTGEEYAAARASTPNAHYTSAEVIQSIWQALQRFGLHEGAHILEPSMGVGHFFGLMPEELYPGTRRTGVEIDSITARIATVLYPDSTVHRKAFEDTTLPGNFFDVVIGNIPFGNFPVYDPAYRRVPALTRSIHDYFLAKSLDIVRPGGLLALITSRYTMDKQDSTVRRYLADRSRLLGAVRLPNTTFKANAGTEVTTDILFLQKRSASVPNSEESWRELGSIRVANEPMAINEYFVRHPEMMLGQMALEQGQHGTPTPALTGTFTPELLTNAVSLLPSGVYVSRDRASNAVPTVESDIPALGTVKDGGFADHNGLIVVRKGDCFEPVTFPASVCSRIRGMLTVRGAVREVFRTQLADASEQHISEARHKLNRAYDRFIGRFGPLNSKENVKAFAGDPDQPLLLSLENYDPEDKRATRTAIFERRTLDRYRPVDRVETAAEALVISLNETGQIHWARMEGLTGKSAREFQCELGALVYQNPEGAVWETADCYLSGNVRAKLVSAESAAQIDPAYRRNIEALRAVQPKDLEPSEIEARLGSSWIPVSDIREFLAELLGVPVGQVKVAYAEAIATWTVELDYGAKYIVSNTTQHGTARFRASELIEQALNGRTPTAYDEDAEGNRVINQQETIAAREKQQQLKDRFREWVWQDSARAQRLAGVYNFQFNNLRLREFDGSHLTLPGMVRLALRDGDLSLHQKNAVWRILQSGSTLLAHVVGAGKTWTMTGAAMELRRLGLAKKPMFVVPNHLVDQWGTEFLRLYPQAQLFIAGKDHFTNGSRQQAMARIATGNYDAVIVSHRSFEFLPISDEFLNRFIDEQVAELDSAIAQAQDSSDDHRRIVKELEKAKKRLAAKRCAVAPAALKGGQLMGFWFLFAAMMGPRFFRRFVLFFVAGMVFFLYCLVRS